ncbi:PhzF family phenazine biosynthesis protein [candidate division KSB1 bacterium]|nr:PhzF family phenazine biosynthesis protein [candidate division KSB1 bacterium]
MKIQCFQIDAFTDRVFKGNPAAVCPLEQWLDDDVLQAIAMENNLSETAYFVPHEDHYHIRWFTPTHEVPLCGHATLAASFVIFNYLDNDVDELKFSSASGFLYVNKMDDMLQLNFPTSRMQRINPSNTLVQSFPLEADEVYRSDEYLLVFSSEKQIKDMQPDFDKIKLLDLDGVIITAPGETVDFVSRFFAPKIGIDEDPVTGSAHRILTPYWSQRLNKTHLIAHQVSKRGGVIYCTDAGDRTLIAGKAVEFMRGTIDL